MSLFFRAGKYFTYWLNKVNQHSLHSPFLFEFYHKVLKDNNQIQHSPIENLRTKLLTDKRIIKYKDPGASQVIRERSVSDIASSSLSDKKFSRLYLRMIDLFNPALVVELGTSLGINSLYMAQSGKQVVTFEGVAALSAISRRNFEKLKISNIIVIEGDIHQTLPSFLDTIPILPFVFFDANHTYEATIKYFSLCLNKAGSDSIFIFDDIYWSEGMAKAWGEIKSHPSVQVSLDLYRCGIIFFDETLTPQHLALEF